MIAKESFSKRYVRDDAMVLSLRGKRRTHPLRRLLRAYLAAVLVSLAADTVYAAGGGTALQQITVGTTGFTPLVLFPLQLAGCLQSSDGNNG
ncbi:MAG: hypothetical protein D6788_03110 [Planctomycetota bacterium]|nr:MAG: hypothetical protein D6788_03110 [Planctomycetota bacterium]